MDTHDSPKIKKFVTNSGLSRPRISREQCQKMEPTLLHYTIEACLELGSLISAFEIIENCGWLSKKKEGSADNISQDVKMLCLRLALTKIIEHLKTARTEAALSQAISVVVALIGLEQKCKYKHCCVIYFCLLFKYLGTRSTFRCKNLRHTIISDNFVIA